MFSKFIWNNTKPIITLKLLHLPHDRGGLQFPNLKWYYWSAQLRTATFNFSTGVPPAWVDIEKTSAKNLRLNSKYIYSKEFILLIRTTQNPFLKNTIDIWYKVHEHFKDTTLSFFSTIYGNASRRSRWRL